MLPSDDAIWVGEELARRFGLPQWQFAMTATDANRFVLRFARHLTGRPRIAVMDWCYHGTVDETLRDARRRPGRAAARGCWARRSTSPRPTAVVPFNDADALDRRLAEGDVACVLMEPALTNIGIVLPETGYLDAVREITRRHGVLLVIDETHTLCAGPGRRARPPGASTPTSLVVGKPIGGRGPDRGVRHDRGGRRRACAARCSAHEIDVAGVGGTLTANALALAAARAALSTALREEDFAVAIPLAERFATASPTVIDRARAAVARPAARLPGGVLVLPAAAQRRRAAAAIDDELDGVPAPVVRSTAACC